MKRLRGKRLTADGRPRDGVTSLRYPDRMDCPGGCGLVACDALHAAVRSHQRRARRALKHGHILDPCPVATGGVQW